MTEEKKVLSTKTSKLLKHIWDVAFISFLGSEIFDDLFPLFQILYALGIILTIFFLYKVDFKAERAKALALIALIFLFLPYYVGFGDNISVGIVLIGFVLAATAGYFRFVDEE